MFARLTRQCDNCRSHIYVEKKTDVKDIIVDGRRHITCLCPVCDEKIEIRVRMVPKE